MVDGDLHDIAVIICLIVDDVARSGHPEALLAQVLEGFSHSE